MREHSRHAEAHIDSIVRQEEEALERRSNSERLADSVGVFAGSLPFVVLHLGLVIAWLLVNSGQISGGKTVRPLAVLVAWSDCRGRGGHSLQLYTHAPKPDDAPRGASGPPEFAITTLLQMVRAIC